jgi:hypothetical protein
MYYGKRLTLLPIFVLIFLLLINRDVSIKYVGVVAVRGEMPPSEFLQGKFCPALVLASTTTGAA